MEPAFNCINVDGSVINNTSKFKDLNISLFAVKLYKLVDPGT